VKYWISLMLVAVLAVGAAQAGNDKGQGEGNGQAQGKGQVTSECNHRANERNMKGQDRKDWVEWCESRGASYKYDYNRYGRERDCYQRANDKNLHGDDRANYLRRCLSDVDSRYYGGGKKQKD
jgi:hypothetical protein